MTTAKHTPGPWVKRWQGGEWLIGHRSRDGLVAACPPVHPVDDAEANARLIAVAPELLEAAKVLMTYLLGAIEHDADNLIGQLQAAIAKAEGRELSNDKLTEELIRETCLGCMEPPGTYPHTCAQVRWPVTTDCGYCVGTGRVTVECVDGPDGKAHLLPDRFVHPIPCPWCSGTGDANQAERKPRRA